MALLENAWIIFLVEKFQVKYNDSYIFYSSRFNE